MLSKNQSNSFQGKNLCMISFMILMITFFGNCTTKSQKAIGLCEHVVISSDSRGFMLEKTHRAFHPWGMNYGHYCYGRLTEDAQSLFWDTLATDFQKMKEMGMNVVRVHLQFDQFMITANRPNDHALAGYKRLLKLAEKTGLYLDITGLACYRPAYRLAWYDSLDESERWSAQSQFWEAIAKATDENPSVFCYDLINEPTIPTKPLKTSNWYTGSLGEYEFCQYITLDPKGRTLDAIRHQWIRQMTTAIRKFDKKTLITVGLLPWSSTFGNVNSVASDLDYISIHIYPKKNSPKAAMHTLEECDVGKPVVIEETFQLHCDIDQWTTFMRESRGIASGWIGFYLLRYSPKELDTLQNKTRRETHYQSWLSTFVEMRSEFSPDSVNFIYD